MSIKDNRKAWQKKPESYRWARCGTMTQETERQHKSANYAAHKKKDMGDYARAMGIHIWDALERVREQEKRLAQ